MGDYQAQLDAEAASWLIEDPGERAEKFRRERMRHYKLIRDLLLDKLDVHNLDVVEIGGGPMPISDLLQCKSRQVIDPLTDEYRKVLPCPDHVRMKGEDLAVFDCYDLAISTNSLDHVEDPALVFRNVTRALRPGGFLALQCPENNALTNPHPAHAHNLTAGIVHRWADADFETVWELNFAEHGFRYGWPVYEGRRGQPSFAMLLRKCSGYA